MFASTSGAILDTPKATPGTNIQSKITDTVKRFSLRSSGPVISTPVSEPTSLNVIDSQPRVRLVPVSSIPQSNPPPVQQPLAQLPVQPAAAPANNIVIINNDSDSEEEMSDHSAPLLASFTGTSAQNPIDWLASLSEYYYTHTQYKFQTCYAVTRLNMVEIMAILNKEIDTG